MFTVNKYRVVAPGVYGLPFKEVEIKGWTDTRVLTGFDHRDIRWIAHQTPPPITFTFILSNYRSRLLFQEESELSSKRWASAPRRPDSPCVLGAPTSREVSQSRFYTESSSDVPETSKLDTFAG
ncbi:Uncharacterized protein DBV15_07536 [Temnothorax longispinosus]|uniref:Uncharacterized protein n=1 Tax=Temnothorax longispinosus TaxID=300112 RepID=A0A4S2JX82_9HYME|nr:Uncharacterized protein DBV15_07536 [Temnothorax longispinosus]